MKQCGIFEPGASTKKNYERHIGRVRWMLSNDPSTKEIDVSADRCVMVAKAYAVRGCPDADREEWDICPEGALPSNHNTVIDFY